MIQIQPFFCLSSPLGGSSSEPFIYGDREWYEKYQSAEFTDDIDYEQILCPLDKHHMRAGARIGDLRLVLPTTHIGDFIWTIMSECVVTDRVLKLFETTGFTGFQTRSAHIARIRRRRADSKIPIPKVWELLVTGKGGDAHPDSGIRLLRTCSGCNKKVYSSFRNGIIVKEEEWDGSDFFTVNGYPRFILITEKVKDLIIESKLINCAIIRSQDVQWGSLYRAEEHQPPPPLPPSPPRSHPPSSR